MSGGPRSGVYTADETAAKFGVSPWLVYTSVRRGDFPIRPIRIGRRLVWSKTAVDDLLGSNEEAGR